ncbi:MAG: GNAT family N-acetyltransferase [Rhodospirillaceae bacterium]|nr:GNAT family N-acetyltransferase [Rhodospirillaceae bacterium]MBT5780641.1 GNAT family N-acetyltransferase [Rhodospirillaceae bacterium]MBT6828626.1 GNAT family N-acetyltransferase [Rhodospirillaceae bacterium]
MASQDFMAGITAGSLAVRLANGAADIDAAQSLRYRVFYEEMTSRPSDEMAAKRRDFDRFDEYCDHLLVIDQDRPAGSEQVVGTYRLLRRSVADSHGGFYSPWEYNIDRVLEQPGEILELGRSCVEAPYRNRASMTLLWRGVAAYVMHYEVPLMFGCASFEGTDPAEHALTLSYLYHFHLAPPEMRPVAQPEHFVKMNLMAKEEINNRAAIRAVPPLIKGYLRLNGFVGDGAVIDPQWNSVDVSIVVKTDLVTRKYKDKLT